MTEPIDFKIGQILAAIFSIVGILYVILISAAVIFVYITRPVLKRKFQVAPSVDDEDDGDTEEDDGYTEEYDSYTEDNSSYYSDSNTYTTSGTGVWSTCSAR